MGLPWHIRSTQGGHGSLCSEAEGVDVGCAAVVVFRPRSAFAWVVLDLPRLHSRIRWESTIYTPDDSFCIDGVNETFPSNILSLIHLCIEDHHIWVMQYKEALAKAEYKREWRGNGRVETELRIPMNKEKRT